MNRILINTLSVVFFLSSFPCLASDTPNTEDAFENLEKLSLIKAVALGENDSNTIGIVSLYFVLAPPPRVDERYIEIVTEALKRQNRVSKYVVAKLEEFNRFDDAMTPEKLREHVEAHDFWIIIEGPSKFLPSKASIGKLISGCQGKNFQELLSSPPPGFPLEMARECEKYTSSISALYSEAFNALAREPLNGKIDAVNSLGAVLSEFGRAKDAGALAKQVRVVDVFFRTQILSALKNPDDTMIFGKKFGEERTLELEKLTKLLGGWMGVLKDIEAKMKVVLQKERAISAFVKAGHIFADKFSESDLPLPCLVSEVFLQCEEPATLGGLAGSLTTAHPSQQNEVVNTFAECQTKSKRLKEMYEEIVAEVYGRFELRRKWFLFREYVLQIQIKNLAWGGAAAGAIAGTVKWITTKAFASFKPDSRVARIKKQRARNQKNHLDDGIVLGTQPAHTGFAQGSQVTGFASSQEQDEPELTHEEIVQNENFQRVAALDTLIRGATGQAALPELLHIVQQELRLSSAGRDLLRKLVNYVIHGFLNEKKVVLNAVELLQLGVLKKYVAR